MPITDFVVGIIESIGRFAGRLFGELLFEVVIKGTGYVLLKAVLFDRGAKLDPDSVWCAAAGILFWSLVVIGCIAWFKH